MDTETSFSLDRLLAWLDGDPLEAGRKYVRFQQELIVYLEHRGASTVAEELADEALNRVDKRLETSLLSEHFNSGEIADVPNLCRILHDAGAKNSPGPSGRIWEFLSPADQTLAAEITQTGEFNAKQRSSLSRALNKIIGSRDFYCAEDFNRIAPAAGRRKKVRLSKRLKLMLRED